MLDPNMGSKGRAGRLNIQQHYGRPRGGAKRDSSSIVSIMRAVSLSHSNIT